MLAVFEQVAFFVYGAAAGVGKVANQGERHAVGGEEDEGIVP